MNRRSVMVAATGTVTAVAGLLTLGGGLVYAGQLLPAPSRDRALDITAILTDSGSILLPPDRRACLETFAVLLEDSSLVLYGGPIVAGTCGVDQTSPVERTIQRVVLGDPPTGVQVGARFDEYAGLADPGDLGLDFEDVDVPVEDSEDERLGFDTGFDSDTAPAWLLPGNDDWVIMVHGRSATRAESLRLLPTVIDGGSTALLMTYRNDRAGAPTTIDAVGRFGQTEWTDLRAAVEFARSRRAARIVLVGFSQGGSLVSYYLRNEGENGIDGVILDSPLLSLGQTLVQQARLRDIPRPLIPPILLGTRAVAGVRADFAISDVEHVDHLADTKVPILLIHGDADDFVPTAPSDALAAARPTDLVYERIEGAGHVEGWNTDRARYTGAVSRFLDRVFD